LNKIRVIYRQKQQKNHQLLDRISLNGRLICEKSQANRSKVSPNTGIIFTICQKLAVWVLDILSFIHVPDEKEPPVAAQLARFDWLLLSAVK
jgi:hypothetical protein